MEERRGKTIPQTSFPLLNHTSQLLFGKTTDNTRQVV